MTPFSPDKPDLEKKPEQILEKLPEAIDNEGTLFAYGFLLDHENLKRLFEESRKGKEVNIHEAGSIDEAEKLANENPGGVVILRNVKMEGVRAQIITYNQFTEAYKKKFGEEYYYNIDEGHEYLYVVPAKEGERGRNIEGGLIIGLNNNDLKYFDIDEAVEPEKNDGVYFRKKVPELEISGKKYKPDNIKFYSGNVGDIHEFLNPEDKASSARIARSAILDKKMGRELSDSAKWPHSEEHRVRKKWEGEKYD